MLPTHGNIRSEHQSEINLDCITIEEIRRTIKKPKKRKAEGPDNIPMEIFKEMTEEGLDELRKLFQKWWDEEDIPGEELRARVVLIYKKGNTNLYENYRPTSLLNSTYKIFAAIMQKRIAAGLDKHLQNTQFGFRQKRSTADAIFLTRRAAEYGEKTTNKVMLLLLDWEKAFDRINRDKMQEAFEKIGIPLKMRNILKALYKNTTFKTEIDGVESKWETQHTGIRQGCPLSPYLFIIDMTVMFDAIKKDIGGILAKHRLEGFEFDEIMYADDTICISTDTKALNKHLAAIEERGKNMD